MDENGRPKLLKHKEYFVPEEEPFQNDREAYKPIVWQCRYGGVEVPDHLWKYEVFGKHKKYSESQAEDMISDDVVMTSFDNWVKEFSLFVKNKGKVEPGKYRAYGYEPPGHFLDEVKLGIRHVGMMIGLPPSDSSPAQQQEQGLNQDKTLHYKRSEGENLRK